MKLLILCIFVSLSSFAQISQYSYEFQGDSGEKIVHEVLTARLDQDQLNQYSRELANFYVQKDLKPVFQLYVAPSFETQNQFQISSPIEKEVVLKNLSFLKDDLTSIDLTEEWFEPLKSREPQAEVDAIASLDNEFKQFYKKNYRVRKLSLVLARTLVNGTVASIGFIAGDLPLSVSITLGSLTGLMSGSLQLVNKHVIDFLSTNKFEFKFRKLLGLKTSGIKASSFLASHLKWFSLEALFLTVLDVARFSLGVLPERTMMQESISLGTTSLKSLISQGAVDTSVAKELGPKIKEAINAKDFAKAAKLQFRTELIGFSSSMTWAAAAITDMMGLPIGNYLFIGMGSAGGINHLRLVLKDKWNHLGDKFKEIFLCNRFFRKN